MNVNCVLWALRLAVIALGFIIGYIIGASEPSGVIKDYFDYCESVMP